MAHAKPGHRQRNARFRKVMAVLIPLATDSGISAVEVEYAHRGVSRVRRSYPNRRWCRAQMQEIVTGSHFAFQHPQQAGGLACVSRCYVRDLVAGEFVPPEAREQERFALAMRLSNRTDLVRSYRVTNCLATAISRLRGTVPICQTCSASW